MVEKRTLAFVTLAVLIWALTATGFMAYYYLQHLTYSEQLQQRQKLMDEFVRNSEDSLTKWNLLAADYGALYGEYQLFQEGNYASLMGKYEKLIVNLKGNYTDLLNVSPDLNETYNLLWQKYQTLNQQTVIERSAFGELLSEFYKLFTSMALKEMGTSISEVTMIQVNLLIDYGNATRKWYNVSAPLGATLFNLTRTVAKIEYSYWPTMEPGHILITSINDSAEGYWLWYYWDEEKGDWVLGPVGCDAWMLKNGGVYKWHQSRF
jgi:hypothetical protein